MGLAQVDGAIPAQTCRIKPEAAERESSPHMKQWITAVVIMFNTKITKCKTTSIERIKLFFFNHDKPVMLP